MSILFKRTACAIGVFIADPVTSVFIPQAGSDVSCARREENNDPGNLMREITIYIVYELKDADTKYVSEKEKLAPA